MQTFTLLNEATFCSPLTHLQQNFVICDVVEIVE